MRRSFVLGSAPVLAVGLGLALVACAGQRASGSTSPMAIGVEPDASATPSGSWTELCRAGDADACYSLVLEHRFADASKPESPDSPLRGLEGDASDAVVRELLAPHCEAGHAASCAEVALTFPLAFGSNDPNRAVNELMRKLYRERACDEGDSSSCTTLADDFIADEEFGVANFYLLRACELGDSNAAEAACKALDAD